jgi:N-acetylneuraminate synthase
MGVTVAIAAVALGAAVIEKHITLARAEGGVDAAFSLEPHELKQLCESTRDAALAIGQVNYQRSDSERKNMVFRRSIYAVKDIAEGEMFTKDNIRIIRPGYGMAPKYYEKMLNTKASSDFSKGDSI